MRIEAGAVVAGRYEVERELGRGGMGAVFVARDRKFGTRVALKVAAASGAAHEEFRARFEREARLGHRLGRTRGFVRALDWGELDDGVQLYLAMDLVADARPLDLASGDLAARLGRLLEAAELVAEAHRQGIVHRDLKPANFLQTAAGELHLTDFGLAKALAHDGADATAPDDAEPTGALTRSGAGMGTPAYMAPEQFDDVASADPRADVYALGVMLFEALTGERPYPGADFRSIYMRQLAVLEGRSPAPRPRDRRPDVAPALDDLCVRALAVDRAVRLADGAAFAAALRAALPGGAAAGPAARPIAAHGASALAPTRREPAPGASPDVPVLPEVGADAHAGVPILPELPTRAAGSAPPGRPPSAATGAATGAAQAAATAASTGRASTGLPRSGTPASAPSGTRPVTPAAAPTGPRRSRAGLCCCLALLALPCLAAGLAALIYDVNASTYDGHDILAAFPDEVVPLLDWTDPEISFDYPDPWQASLWTATPWTRLAFTVEDAGVSAVTIYPGQASPSTLYQEHGARAWRFDDNVPLGDDLVPGQNLVIAVDATDRAGRYARGTHFLLYAPIALSAAQVGGLDPGTGTVRVRLDLTPRPPGSFQVWVDGQPLPGRYEGDVVVIDVPFGPQGKGLGASRVAEIGVLPPVGGPVTTRVMLRALLAPADLFGGGKDGKG